MFDYAAAGQNNFNKTQQLTAPQPKPVTQTPAPTTPVIRDFSTLIQGGLQQSLANPYAMTAANNLAKSRMTGLNQVPNPYNPGGRFTTQPFDLNREPGRVTTQPVNISRPQPTFSKQPFPMYNGYSGQPIPGTNAFDFKPTTSRILDWMKLNQLGQQRTLR